jgi:hypothetical protein
MEVLYSALCKRGFSELTTYFKSSLLFYTRLTLFLCLHTFAILSVAYGCLDNHLTKYLKCDIKLISILGMRYQML